MTTLESRRRDDVERAVEKLFQVLAREITALADLERQHAVLRRTPDQLGIAAGREHRTGIARGAAHHVAVAALHQHVGDDGRQSGALRHRQQMPLALQPRNLDQRGIIEHGRAAQHGAGHQDLVLARELIDQMRRRVVQVREALGEVDARGKLRMRDEIDQEVVEEIDELGPKIGGILEEQLGDGARDFAASPRITAFDDIVQSGNERRGNGHENATRRGHAAGAPLVQAAPQSGNLAPRGEGSVRPGAPRIGRKKPRLARDGPCPGGQKALYQRQFIFSYDPRSESGPERTRSFLLPERGLAEDAARRAVGKFRSGL
ncbi:hypothetical protein ABH973_002535 [Bradyrhizobium ottawaense]